MKNINFHPDMIEKIISGIKIRTRRPMKNNAHQEPYSKGETVCVNSSSLHIKILGIVKEPLHNINLADVLEEGFSSLGEFKTFWNTRIYNNKPEYQWDKNPMVWNIFFKEKNEPVNDQIF